MVVDGKMLASRRAEILKKTIDGLGFVPRLAVVLLGNDPASQIYVNLKIKKAAELGIEAEVRQDLNTGADGIIVQLPGGEDLINSIPPQKDVDGLTGKSPYLSATVKGILSILSEVFGSPDWVKTGKTVTVVGQGRLVGKPLSDYMEKNGVNIIRCDIHTANLAAETLKADILVSATGQAKLITAGMVKPGAVVIDCGSPKAEVDFENVKEIAGAVTPVPGGVGPMTVISLLENTVEAAIRSRS